MTGRYFDGEIVEDPEPARVRVPRELRPVYLDDLPAPRTRELVPASAHQLPAYRHAFAPARQDPMHLHIDLRVAPERWAALSRDLADLFTRLGQQAHAALEPFRRLAEQWTPPGTPPPRELRDRDPRAYALQLRQTRNTGPARPTAGQSKRPRRHGSTR